MKLRYAILLASLLAVTVSACGKKEAPPPAAPAPAPAPTAAPAQPVPPPQPAAVAVTNVNLGNAIGADKRVAAAIESFAKNDTIYAAVETQGSGTTTLKAKWTYHKGDKVALVNESSQTINATGPAVSEFHISKPDGWPVGDYQVEIIQDDKAFGTKKFTVK